MCVVLFWLGIHCPESVYAQAEERGKISFQVISQEPLPPADVRTRRIVIEGPEEVQVGSLLSEQGQRVLSIQNRADVILPHNLPALVARDGSVILQYGDKQDLSHPVVTDLHWLNAEGKEVASLEGYYSADALVALSDDGFTAVAGSRVKESRGKVLALFNAKGERLWERPVGEGRNVHAEPLVTAKGTRVVVVTTDGKDPLKDHLLLLHDAQGNELNSIDTMGIIHRMVAVDEGKTLFVEAKKHHALIELSGGSLVWSIESRLRLIAPRAATTGPDGRVLFVLVIEWPGKPQSTYQWRLKALDASNGQELGVWDLPKEMPSTKADVFGRITDDRIGILFGPDQLSISWSR
jgi:hypothetical protein